MSPRNDDDRIAAARAFEERVQRAEKIGRELAAINTALAELRIAYGNFGGNSFESDLHSELDAQRDRLRRELYDMG